ncbi:MAG: TIM barrel protein [Planctomycetaceae bacterium]|nr:TIM barrel protein [Planctomycetaceae bacterium]
MIKVSMRIDYTLENRSLEDQIRLAADAGADAVETGELKGYDCRKAAAVAARCGISFVACGFYDIWNARVGAPFAAIRDNLDKTIACAKELGCTRLLSLAIDSTERGPAGQDAFLRNVEPVVRRCEDHGMTLVFESHSTKYPNPLVDMSRYFLDTSRLACDLIQRLGSDNVRLLFDFYHIQSMEGDIMMKLKANIDLICHFHIAGVPDRDEPMNGELHYPNLVRLATALGYDGYFGLEYFPTDKDDLAALAAAVAYIKSA